jgi:tetratricopeptide (TPR) repeat protein
VNKGYLIILVLFVFIIGGCGTTVKQQWYDFTAYYNTFYNANQYFDAAYEENRSLVSSINPNELIRIHPPPTNGGAQNFERAIEKSADILRNHSRSKYVDEALELIGVSYFYRQEYFAALEKFQELYSSTDNPEKKMSATLWEGRTYMELEMYGEGARFMESRIESLETWSPEELSEARAVLAQLFTYQGDLHQAGNQLLLALDNLKGSELRPRAYFHYGQIMERMENLLQARYAFSSISDMRPSFDLEYHAKLKEAEILRLQENYNEAGRLLRTMTRDDKFFDYRLELLYQIAMTERLKNNPQIAEDYFQDVLQSATQTPDRELVARTYYGLAEIYRFNYDNLQMAAAYYDSAARTNVDRGLLPVHWDAENLARSFGEYTNVVEEIAHLDSLLTLGRMSSDEFDEKIAEIRQQKLDEIEEQRLEDQSQDAFRQQLDFEEEIEGTTDAMSDGFLNINNRTLLEQSGLRFRSIWGNRPLSDDWRRREAVSGTMANFENQQTVLQSEETGIQEDDEITMNLQLDLSEIPFESHEQDSVEVMIFAKYYQLGNIFQLNLDMPDSAKVYYEKVIEHGVEGSPVASSTYALMDILIEEGDMEYSSILAHQLIDSYPGSPLARRAADRLNLEIPPSPIEITSAPDSMVSQQEMLSDTVTAEDYAKILLEHSDNSRSRELAANYMLEAAEVYIKAAREDTLYEIRQNRWYEVQTLAEEFELLEELIGGSRDTLFADESDLNIPGMEGAQSVSIEDIRLIYPYYGEMWDKSRGILKQLRNTYGETNAASRASILLEELERYPVLIRSDQPVESLPEFPDDQSGG